MTSYDCSATDALSVSISLADLIQAQCVLAEALSLSPSTTNYSQVGLVVAETANIAPSSSANRESVDTLVETALIGSSTVPNKVVLVALTEAGSFTDAVTPNAILRLLASEGGVFSAVLVVSGEAYTVWVANADTLAHSRYDNFDFNSMCRLGSKYYGARDDGIYELAGSTDAGSNVEWYVTLPTTDFGTSKAKRVPKIYMGFSNGGDLRIKVIGREGNTRVYGFSKTSDGYSESGAAIGRGVKSRYFTFDLYNAEGGDVELEHVEFFPVVLRRMINS